MGAMFPVPADNARGVAGVPDAGRRFRLRGTLQWPRWCGQCPDTEKSAGGFRLRDQTEDACVPKTPKRTPRAAAEAGRQEVQPCVVTSTPAKSPEKSAPKGRFAPVARERTNFLGSGGGAGEGLRKGRAAPPCGGPALAPLRAEKAKRAPLRLGKESPRSRPGGPPGRRARGGGTGVLWDARCKSLGRIRENSIFGSFALLGKMGRFPTPWPKRGERPRGGRVAPR